MMKKVFVFLCATMLTFGFVACSDDDDDKDDEKTAFLVNKISIENHQWPEDSEEFTFNYDNSGKITSLSYGEDGVITVSYEKSKITIKYAGYNEPDVLTLNDKGYVTSSNSEGDEYKYTYDGQGQLIKIEESGDAYSFTWKDGNIIKISGGDDYSYIYTYTSHDNKANIDLSAFLGDQMKEEMFLPEAYGKMNKKLLETCTIKEDGDIDEYRYEYTFNEQGVVTKVVEYCDDELLRTYTIEYVK